jgi:curli biogenesis system outer membrane secretion channel CsgG
MKRVALMALVVIVSSAVVFSAPKKRVAILDFDFASIQHWWDGNWDIGKGISDLLVVRLVKDGTYSVVERKALNAILAEQNFSNSDRANPSSAAQIGKLLGVDCIIVGSITQFGTEDKKVGVGGVGGRWGGFGGGKVGTSKGKAHVVLDMRMVDVDTGEILVVAEGKGESSRSGLLLAGVGAGRGGFGAEAVLIWGAAISVTPSSARRLTTAADEAARQLIAGADRIPTRHGRGAGHGSRRRRQEPGPQCRKSSGIERRGSPQNYARHPNSQRSGDGKGVARSD